MRVAQEDRVGSAPRRSAGRPRPTPQASRRRQSSPRLHRPFDAMRIREAAGREGGGKPRLQLQQRLVRHGNRRSMVMPGGSSVSGPSPAIVTREPTIGRAPEMRDLAGLRIDDEIVLQGRQTEITLLLAPKIRCARRWRQGLHGQSADRQRVPSGAAGALRAAPGHPARTPCVSQAATDHLAGENLAVEAWLLRSPRSAWPR